MSTQPSGDLTPESASPTDIAPLGRSGPKPAHEKTAAEEADAAPWNAIEADEGFRTLLREKVRFIVPATIFFMVYFFALPVLVGWWPELMKREVWGHVNIAYLFALSQFVMAMVLAYLYLKAAAKWDKAAAAVLAKFNR